MTKRAKKVSLKDFVEDPGTFLERLGETGAPVFVTFRNRPVAALVDPREYEEGMERLAGYEKIMKDLARPEKARMTAHARVMAGLGRRGKR